MDYKEYTYHNTYMIQCNTSALCTVKCFIVGPFLALHEYLLGLGLYDESAIHFLLVFFRQIATAVRKGFIYCGKTWNGKKKNHLQMWKKIPFWYPPLKFIFNIWQKLRDKNSRRECKWQNFFNIKCQKISHLQMDVFAISSFAII